ncbi:MAG: glycosyltransferase [Lachnospiraceae bacterium]|nr:glycosyltransferase [Lachnospiraceae bacterium]
MNIQVIIPAYRPDDKLIKLLDKLKSQTLQPSGINIIWSRIGKEEDAIIAEVKSRFGDVRFLEVDAASFDHGGTRRRAVRNTPCDIFVMMTQDAIPKSNDLIEKLTAPMRAQMEEAQGTASEADESADATDMSRERRTDAARGTAHGHGEIACVYARQLPGKESSPYEKLSRLHNYSDLSKTKTKSDIEKLGIKAFFCSDVCCAYRRDIYEACGGYVRNALFNEDMIMARRFLDKGYAVRYEATAAVIHSHDYSLMQQLRRNFDIGASQAMNPDTFGGISSESEGKKFVISSTKLLLKKKKLLLIPGFYMQCFYKLAGYRLGKKYKNLPDAVIMKLTSNKIFWKQMKERN